MKKLYRSKKDQMLAGVLGGIGEYAGVDPTILRLCWVFFTLFTGCFPGVIFYIFAWIIIPEKELASENTHSEPVEKTNKTSTHLAIEKTNSHNDTESKG